MKNLKKLSREKLSKLTGGGSCAGTCSDGSFVYVSSCTSCISYSGGAACYNSHEESLYVETC